MEKVKIWYLTDNEKGEKLATSIDKLGLNCEVLNDSDFAGVEVEDDYTHVFVVDLLNTEYDSILDMLKVDERLQRSLKFLFLNSKEVKKGVELSLNLMHLEIISRPIKDREFILLLEKSIFVECYRKVLKKLSVESEENIASQEKLLNIKRHHIISHDHNDNLSGKFFKKVLSYEKNILNEQECLNEAIKKYTLCCQKEMFDMDQRINAEEMLTVLRRKEMLDANDFIKAQESLLGFSAKELNDANSIIKAREQLDEFSRNEILRLTNELDKYKKENAELKDKLEK